MAEEWNGQISRGVRTITGKFENAGGLLVEVMRLASEREQDMRELLAEGISGHALGVAITNIETIANLERDSFRNAARDAHRRIEAIAAVMADIDADTGYNVCYHEELQDSIPFRWDDLPEEDTEELRGREYYRTHAVVAIVAPPDIR
jgi:hypothetical protein